MTQATYDHWVKDTVLLERTETEAGLSLVIVAKSRFAVEWLEHRLAGGIRRSIAALTALDEAAVDLAFVTKTEVESSPMMEVAA